MVGWGRVSGETRARDAQISSNCSHAPAPRRSAMSRSVINVTKGCI